MIVTNDFILINFPKTGSTFARQVIGELYKDKLDKTRFERWLSRLKLKKKYLYREIYVPRMEYLTDTNEPADQHGRYEQVPEEYRHLPVLSVVRDPVIRNISFYEYGWWKSRHESSREDILANFPAFPDLDFGAYLLYQKYNSRLRDTGVVIPDDIGEQTVQFIQFFFRDPQQVFKRLGDDYIYSGAYRQDLPDLTLLGTENLNRDLCDYLYGCCGFDRNDVEFILDRKPVRPEQTERKTEEERRRYLSDELVSAIRHSERYLYRIYADFGIEYPQAPA